MDLSDLGGLAIARSALHYFSLDHARPDCGKRGFIELTMVF